MLLLIKTLDVEKVMILVIVNLTELSGANNTWDQAER